MLKALSLWQSIDKNFLLKPLEVIEAQRFVVQLAGILKQADDAMSDEAESLSYDLILSHFFEDIFGFGSTSCRSNLIFKHTEIATYQEQTCKVLGLVVPTDQRISMITRRQINKPVFHEAICSYLFEYFQHNNREITYIWISNALEWFLFDSADIDQWLNQSVSEEETLWQIFETHAHEPEQWKVLIKDYWKQLSEPISATIFSLYGIQEQLTSSQEMVGEKLLTLQKVLSPIHLLKKRFSINTTPVKLFFEELFYIIGVEEVTQKHGNKLRLLPEKGGLFNYFFQQIESKYLKEEERIEKAWYTCINFVNQFILQKALNAHHQLWNSTNKEQDGDEEKQVFSDLVASLSNLPFLTEKKGDEIVESWDFSFEMRVYADTVLRDKDQQSLQFTVLTAAKYLEKWFHAYEIVLDYRPRVQKEVIFIHIDDIIHGLQRFTKLNTLSPYLSKSFLITLCQNPLKDAIIRVFNEQQGWVCADFEELEENIKEIPVKKANACIDHLSVCNPASNKGDIFLYCFEEWLSIKMQLGILCDGNGEFLPHYDAYQSNNYWWWLDKEGGFYTPEIEDRESLRLLSAMRHEFEHVFGRVFLGVEVSSLFTNITYTRLYLLYLKFALPTEDGTVWFPSLNNNVRHANPLISRFPLDLDIQKALAPTPYGFEDYKYVVQLMKIARSSVEIAEAQQMLKQFKQLFRAHVSSNDRRQKRLEKLEQTYHQEFMTLTLLDFGGSDPARDEKRQQMKTEISKLKEELKDEADGIWYEEAFEWRLEFPEILDAQGKFVGFDLVICLPPSIRQDQLGTLRHYFKQRYKTYHYQAKLFMYYVELGVTLLKGGGQAVLLLPHAWTHAQYASSLRDWIVNFQLDSYELLDMPQLQAMGKLMLSNYKKILELEHRENGFEEWMG